MKVPDVIVLIPAWRWAVHIATSPENFSPTLFSQLPPISLNQKICRGISKNPKTALILSYIPYTTKYEDDPTLEEGKEVVEQSGYTGCTSETYRIIKLNGEVVSKTLLSKDTYDPMTRIIRRGTKAVETNAKSTEIDDEELDSEESTEIKEDSETVNETDN